MQVIIFVTDTDAGLEASARLARVDGPDGPRWLGHGLAVDPVGLALPPDATLAAVVDRVLGLEVDRDGAAA